MPHPVFFTPQVLLKNEPVHPFGLAVYGDYIFWTDWVRRAVLRADKYTGGDMKVLRADIPQQPMGIIAVANDTNSCMYYSFKVPLSPICCIPSFLKALHFAKFTLSMFSHNNMCLNPVSVHPVLLVLAPLSRKCANTQFISLKTDLLK